MTTYDPNTQQVIPKGSASVVDWIKAAIKFVYPEKENCSSSPIYAKWNSPDEAIDMMYIQTMLDCLYDD